MRAEEICISWEGTFAPTIYAWSNTTGEPIRLEPEERQQVLKAINTIEDQKELEEAVSRIECDVEKRIKQERNTELRSVLEYLYPEEL